MAKKKSLLGKPIAPIGPNSGRAVEGGPSAPARPRTPLSMRQLIAKKLAAEKLQTARRAN